MTLSRRYPLLLAAAMLAGMAQADTGALVSLGRDGQPNGECPLAHTTVKAEITGFLARVNVTQEFHNKAADKIEAVYTFPLPPNSAVDDMTMHVGDRTIKGLIKKREEAQAIFEAARRSGHLASLLDQERPNIFTQSVTNIGPNQTVKIEISYVELMKFDEGAYEFRFPMVVAPRYMPGQPTGRKGGGWAPDTTRVPDASRISPHVTPPGTRAGHDISVEVTLDAGVPIDSLASPTHEINLERPSVHQAHLTLKEKDVLPNKDFILKYDVLSRKMQDAVLTYRKGNDGFFTLLLTPPERVPAADVTPKELVFLLDTSGSMHGFPIEKAKEAMNEAIGALDPRDTFNLITFSGDTHILFPQPVPATRENLATAQQFLLSRSGNGGTEMMLAIRAALAPSRDNGGRVRVVCFMTDGEVGNDMEIINEVQQHPEARVFAFGIGSSVNHFLLDNVAKYGRGEVEYVGLNDDGSAAAKRFHERIQSPLLTDVSIDWGGLSVAEVYPQRLPDLFTGKPLTLTGRFTKPGSGTIHIRGKQAGKPYQRDIAVTLPASEPRHDVLATLWARTKVADLMSQDFLGMQRGQTRPEIKEAVTQLGLQYRLMTQFTSFVAVEEKTVVQGGHPRQVQVPVEMPEGMSYQGVFGGGERVISAAASMMMQRSLRAPTGFVGDYSSRQAPAAPPMPMPKTVPQPDAPQAKLHPQLVAAVQNGSAKLLVRIWVQAVSPQALSDLQKLGFEPSQKPGANVYVGRISAAKLNELIRLANVRYVEPGA